ncbi:ferredoxin--NADP reductase [Streptomyces sp. B-S-A8]|uniref:Ferredoxin--NADP reductase n=1 Tax=Streptomyces solicavernae TaxID=3043614 RepID=A0ABT6RVN8_9ACTN|nr:ferredoxin--NADP reductase [Streptomyces sp. B-S-A8]MDI3388518.1 ferredoxin--NADP reductase [Streptomyces sp. B-S-A8]
MTSRTPLTVRVVKVVQETADAHSLILEPAQGSADKFRYKPGQFLTVRVPSEREGGSVARCYSLCSSPMRDENLKVTVKRTADGYGSNWICDRVTEGDVLEVLRPAGTFTPDSLDEDLLLCAAGSGITPVMSILSSCLHAGTGSVTLLYANRDEQSVIFRDELAALCRQYGERLTVVHWLESVQGRPTRTAVQALARPYAAHRAFVCGPGPFMDLTTDALARVGLPPDRVTLERFTSLTSDPFTVPEPEPEPEPELEVAPGNPAGTVEVELDGEKQSLAWPRESKLLDVLLAAGLDAPYSCREGNCSACACVVVEGEAAMERNEVLDAADLADGLLLACQALPVSDRLRITYDG